MSSSGSSDEKAEPDAAPSWFNEALSMQPEEIGVSVDGARINILRWGRGACRPLVFVHGNGAHARWWSFVAPFFAGDRTVAALDLAGMGDSERRAAYSPEGFAAEIAAAIRLVGTGETPADVVGHSFGGLVSTWFAHAYPDLLHSLVLIDTPFLSGDTYDPPWRTKAVKGRHFASRAEAIRHFRLLPPQDCENDYIFDFIARHSVKEIKQGWTWKASASPWSCPGFRTGFWDETNGRLREIARPVAFIRGEGSSLSDDEVVRRWRARRPQAPIIEIPGARHHVHLDQPIALIGILRCLLTLLNSKSEWR